MIARPKSLVASICCEPARLSRHCTSAARTRLGDAASSGGCGPRWRFGEPSGR